MAMAKPTYVVDIKGRKTAVMLNLKTYRDLLARLEDLEDALTLDQRVPKAKRFRDYAAIRKDLVAQGRL